MRLPSLQSVLLLLSGAAIGAAVTWLLIPAPEDSPEQRSRAHTVAVPGGGGASAVTGSPANTGLPTVIDESTRRLLADFAALTTTATPGQPNRSLVARMKAVLQQSDESRRKLQFSLLLEGLRAEDAPMLPAMFEELRGKGLAYSVEEMNFFAERWGELDPTAALKHYSSEKMLKNDNMMLERIFSGWARKNPREASQWALKQPQPLHNDAVFGTAMGWARHDPSAATAFALSLPDAKLAARTGAQVFWQVLYGQGVDAAAAWYDGLPAEGAQTVKDRVWPFILERQLERGEAAGREWVKKHDQEVR